MNRNFITVETEQGKYENVFTSFSIPKSIDNISSKFMFSTVSGSTKVSLPLKRGQAVRILIDGEIIVTGWIEKVEPVITPEERVINFLCVEKTNDLVVSKLGGVTYNTPITLQEIIKRTCEENNFKVVSQNYTQRLGDNTIKIINKAGTIGSFKTDIESFENEGIQRDEGETAFAFMVKYANKRQVLLTSDKDGNIVITRAGDSISVTNLNVSKAIVEKNIKFIKKVDSEEDRYNTYTIKSQSIGSIDGDGAINGQIGTSTDSEIRKTKICVSISDTSQTAVSAKNTAQWKNNIHKARGLQYQLKTYGFYQTFDKTQLWQLNQIIKVTDDETQTYGTFFVSNREYAQTLKGSETIITLTDKDAYKII